MRMEYERLVRRVFEVNRFDDPMGLANADVFRGDPNDPENIHIEYDHRWLTGVSNSLMKDKKDNNGNDDLYNALDDLDDRLWRSQKAADAMTIIEEAHALLDAHDLYNNGANW